MAHLIERASGYDEPGILTIIAALYFLGFAIKAAAFPFFFWLPAAYHAPPIAVTTIFGGILTKVGIYGMLRVLVFIFPQEMNHLQIIWLVISALTMLVGVFGAIEQRELQRVFSFLIISHVGFIMMGISFNTRLGLTAAIFYLVHHMIVKTALFMCNGIMEGRNRNKDLHNMGGLSTKDPLLTILFFISALALAGIPPLSGFFAKFALLSAAWQAEQYILGGISLVVSLLTIIAVFRVWQEAFWKAQPQSAIKSTQEIVIHEYEPHERRLMFLPLIGLVAFSIGMGLFANVTYEIADRTAEQLLDRSRYTEAVLSDYRDPDAPESSLQIIGEAR